MRWESQAGTVLGKKLNDNDRAGGGGAVAQIMSIIIQFHS